MSEQYEGWANRETWAVALWINNDQGWQESVHIDLRAAAGWVDEYIDGKPHIDACEAGEIIRENVEETLDVLAETNVDTYKNVRDDFGSLWRVDWTELGAAFLRDLAEQDADR